MRRMTFFIALLVGLGMGVAPASAGTPVGFQSNGTGTGTVTTYGSGYALAATTTGTLSSVPLTTSATSDWSLTTNAIPPLCSTGSTPVYGTLIATTSVGTTTWSLSGSACDPNAGGYPYYRVTTSQTMTYGTGAFAGYTGSATGVMDLSGSVFTPSVSSSVTGSVTPP
jgi:hypothetical protein